jgi:hypothetical protein
LFSGGWDSVYCAVVAIETAKEKPLLCFFDYGQSYLDNEVKATARVSEILGCDLARMTIPCIPSNNGIFDGRNERLLAAAIEQHKPQRIYIGSRNLLPMLDKYKDSNWVWARQMAKKYNVQIKTPCTALPKWFIRRRVMRSGIPACAIFSTESENI